MQNIEIRPTLRFCFYLVHSSSTDTIIWCIYTTVHVHLSVDQVRFAGINVPVCRPVSVPISGYIITLGASTFSCVTIKVCEINEQFMKNFVHNLSVYDAQKYSVPSLLNNLTYVIWDCSKLQKITTPIGILLNIFVNSYASFIFIHHSKDGSTNSGIVHL